MAPVYLDCNASTPIEPEVLQSLVGALREVGNPHADHGHGRAQRERLEAARHAVAAAFGRAAPLVSFTSGATESIDLAHGGLRDHLKRMERRHIVTTAVEHRAVASAVERLRQGGFEVSVVGCDAQGRVDAAELLDRVRADTGLVSMMHVNNETGAVLPIAQVARGLVGHEAYLHVDASQSAGKLQAPLTDSRLDLISLSGHKLHAPVGIGALVLSERAAAALTPRLTGAFASDPRRPGTPSAPLAEALAVALRLAARDGDARRAVWERHRQGVLRTVAALGARVVGPDDGLANVVSVELPGLDAEVARMLVADLVEVGTGSACHASRAPSHVLLAMGRSARQAACVLRFSWCHLTPDVPWEEVVQRLGPHCVVDDSQRGRLASARRVAQVGV